MKKELTPGLFGDFQEGRRSASYDISGLELSSLSQVAEAKRLEKRVEVLSAEVRTKQEEAHRTYQVRYDEFIKKLNTLESRFESLSQDLHSKFAHLTSKMTERNLTDNKTQALIDRHTQLMRQFEARVAQLQRVIEEQDFQILNYKAALEDIRRRDSR